MIKYFIYCRKSSEDEERQILSIEAQLTELREFAKQNNLFVVKEYYESKTAKEPGREVFNFMMSEIQKGNAEGILAWNPDRLARNSIDGGRVIYLVDTGKITSLKFPTFWFEPTPQGKFMLSVAFGQAKYYTDNLRENILRGIRQKIRRGELSAKAPLGYFNEPRLRTIEPNKKTFNKVKEVLRAFATTEYTLTKIQSKMFSLGLVGKDGKLPHLSTIQKILTNPFYYGHFRYRGEVHQGSHKPMISKKLFDRIQEALILNGKPRKKRGPKNFQFLNFAVCGECGYSITAERKIKKSGLKYHYYHCTFKSKTQNCSQTRFLREEVLTEQVKENCQKVSLPDDWREKYLAKVNEWEKENSQSSNLFAQNLKTELSAIKIKIDRLMDGYLEGGFELVEFQEKKNKLMAEKKDIEEKLSDFERKGNHWLELVRNWVIEANQAKNFALENNFSEMKNFIKKIGSNRRILNQRLFVDFKKPWNYLYFLSAESRAKGAGEAEILRNRLMWTRADLNRRPSACKADVLPLNYGPPSYTNIRRLPDVYNINIDNWET
ncbi:MAG: recombinase [Parcubacteria group bacterium Licking1014_17]|nr:MAG: recombinase [Parcubacteria group bacterium Licking1014_17]